jgi:putative FmdB family regulatory protein
VPIYEYRCKKCGHTFELMRRLAARDDAAPCPECKSKRIARVEIQSMAVITGVAPNAMMGEGDPEDFLGGDDDFGMGHGHDHGFDDFDDF